MKRYLARFGLVLLAAVAIARADNLDEQYIQIYNTVKEADDLSAAQPAQARTKYVEAQAALQKLQTSNPEWNARLIGFRLNYVNDRLADLLAKNPVIAAASAGATNAPAAAPAKAAPVTAGDWPGRLAALEEQIQQLQAERGNLEAKLKEALSMQPAAADPRVLAQTEQKLLAAQKENELLKASLEELKSKPAPPADTKALEQARQSLAEANRLLAEEKTRSSSLALEREALQARLKNPAPSAGEMAALRAENELLKKQVSAPQPAPGPVPKTEEAGRELAQARAQLAALASDKELLQLEKTALENRVKQLGSTTSATNTISAPSPELASKLKEVEQERDLMRQKLDAANRSLLGRKGKAMASQLEDLETQLVTARARLAVLESRVSPYTAEELALFKSPETKLADSNSQPGKKSVKELPAGSAHLVAEAQSFFSTRQFDKAEAAYQQVVHQDQKNVPALANLAAIQVEEQHFDLAEQNLKKALAVDPEDGFSYYILGILRFRQAKYDDALDALSRAARLDPQNAEVQNYLGLALSEKGQRVPAEAALRKAIELDPRYGGAHFNLAIVYLSQEPPAVELARWHYQKSLAVGHPRSPELERRLEKK